MFEASPSLTIMPINKNGVQMLGIPQGFNASNVFVGGYYPPGAPASQVNGFFGLNGQWSSDITLPFPVIQTRARSINNSGTVAGLFYTARPGLSTGFMVKNGVTYSITYPDPTQQGTNIEGINDAGVMTGSWTDATGNTHSFLLAADMTTFTLDRARWLDQQPGLGDQQGRRSGDQLRRRAVHLLLEERQRPLQERQGQTRDDDDGSRRVPFVRLHQRLPRLGHAGRPGSGGPRERTSHGPACLKPWQASAVTRFSDGQRKKARGSRRAPLFLGRICLA